MASKTIYLNSPGVTLTNITTAASTGSYQTPSVAKNGGTYRIQIDIDLMKALGMPVNLHASHTLTYTIYQQRTGIFSAQSSIKTGYIDPNGNDVYPASNVHTTKIGKGSSNPYTPDPSDTIPGVSRDGIVSIVMLITNEINAQTCYYVISNLSITLNYDEITYTIKTEVSPESSGTVTGADAGVYSYGASVELQATPNSGYKFLKWNDGVTTASRTVTVTENATYSAIFEKIPPKFTSADMKYLDKQISNTNKVIAGESFVISVGVT